MLNVVSWIVLSMAILTATGLLFSQDWRWTLGLLAVQYFCVFWMVQTHWPLSMAAVKIVTGWMACAILGIAQLNALAGTGREKTGPQGRLFHAFAAGMVLVAVRLT